MIEIKDAKFQILTSEEFQEGISGVAHQNNESLGEVAEDVCILEYEKKVPRFLGKILDELYGSLYSSVPYMEVYGGLDQVNTYISARKGKALAALVFKLDEHEVTVINEAIRIGKDEMARFAGHIFSTYPSVRKITFNAVSSQIDKLGYAIQHFSGTKHTIVPLPSTEKEYTEKLGKSTRRTIQYRLNRVKRTFPSFHHEVQEGENISEEDLLAVIHFNRMRMAEKYKIVDLDRQDVARIIELVKRCGFISVIRIDGHVCAGTILYQTGKSVMSQINAHDPHYNEYRLGTLSCYLMICESIRRNAKEVNLQWGGEEYKYALLGIDHAFDRIQIYRSHLQMLSDTKSILQIRVNNQLRSAMTWLIAQSKKDNHFAKCMNSCIALVKRKKYSDWREQQK